MRISWTYGRCRVSRSSRFPARTSERLSAPCAPLRHSVSSGSRAGPTSRGNRREEDSESDRTLKIRHDLPMRIRAPRSISTPSGTPFSGSEHAHPLLLQTRLRISGVSAIDLPALSRAPGLPQVFLERGLKSLSILRVDVARDLPVMCTAELRHREAIRRQGVGDRDGERCLRPSPLLRSRGDHAAAGCAVREF